MNALIRGILGLLLVMPLALGAASRPATPFTDAELDQLLAPIALYPDTVLSHVLIAATVPEEVEEAAEWLRRHPNLRGQEAVDAVERMDWDPSVKALVAFPEVLERMDEDPEWTENLGQAFLDQEAVVMDRVQYLRDRAYESGNLESLEHVRVVREREYIYLEPAISHVVYVPYYDPWYVYGSWWWPSYPPHRWSYWAGHPARYYRGSTFYWGFGFHLAPTYYYGRFNWPARRIVVTRPHRHYSPSPGYAGRSTVRRDRHDSQSWRQGTERRAHDNRRDEPARAGHQDRAQRGSEARQRRQTRDTRPEHRRNSADVQRELSARRESSRGAPSRTGAQRREAQPQPPPQREPAARASARAHDRQGDARDNRGAERQAPPVREARQAQETRGDERSQERSRDAPASWGQSQERRGTRPQANGAQGRERAPEQRQRGRARSER